MPAPSHHGSASEVASSTETIYISTLRPPELPQHQKHQPPMCWAGKRSFSHEWDKTKWLIRSYFQRETNLREQVIRAKPSPAAGSSPSTGYSGAISCLVLKKQPVKEARSLPRSLENLSLPDRHS